MTLWTCILSVTSPVTSVFDDLGTRPNLQLYFYQKVTCCCVSILLTTWSPSWDNRDATTRYRGDKQTEIPFVKHMNTLMERFHNSAHLSQRSDGLKVIDQCVCVFIFSPINQNCLCVRDCMQAHRKHWLTATPLFNLPHRFHNKLVRLLCKS